MLCVMQIDVLCSARRARLIFSRMSEARAVQMKGLGLCRPSWTISDKFIQPNLAFNSGPRGS
jgi:hypothetical protein